MDSNLKQIIASYEELKNELKTAFKREEVIDFKEEVIRKNEEHTLLEGIGVAGLNNHPFGDISQKSHLLPITTNFAQINSTLFTYRNHIFNLLNDPNLMEGFQNSLQDFDLEKFVENMEESSIKMLWESRLMRCLTLNKNRLGYNLDISNIDEGYYINTISLIAKNLGLGCYSDNYGDHKTISISSEQVVLDFHTSLGGKITKVALSLVSKDMNTDKVEKLLYKNITNNDMEPFRENLRAVAKFDELYLNQRNSSLAHLVEAMILDLNLIFDKENNGDSIRLFNYGHGIPLEYYKFIGAAIVFWTHPSNSSGINDIIVELKKDKIDVDKYYMGELSIELTGENSIMLPKGIPKYIYENENEINLSDEDKNIYKSEPFKFPLIEEEKRVLYINSSSVDLALKYATPLKWIFKLAEPIPFSTYFYKRLANVLGIPLSDEFFLLLEPQPIPDICDVLLQRSFVDFPATSLKTDNGIINLNTTLWTAKVKNHPKLQRLGLVREHMPCYSIFKVPINHPTQILPMLNVIRHQLRFNTLFNSCFNSTTFNPNLADMDQEFILEFCTNVLIEIKDPGITISTLFQDPKIFQDFKLDFNIKEEHPFVSVNWGCESDFPLPDLTEANEILYHTLNIPLVLANVFTLLNM